MGTVFATQKLPFGLFATVLAKSFGVWITDANKIRRDPSGLELEEVVIEGELEAGLDVAEVALLLFKFHP